eukprot:775704_1
MAQAFMRPLKSVVNMVGSGMSKPGVARRKTLGDPPSMLSQRNLNEIITSRRLEVRSSDSPKTPLSQSIFSELSPGGPLIKRPHVVQNQPSTPPVPGTTTTQDNVQSNIDAVERQDSLLVPSDLEDGSEQAQTAVPKQRIHRKKSFSVIDSQTVVQSEFSKFLDKNRVDIDIRLERIMSLCQEDDDAVIGKGEHICDSANKLMDSLMSYSAHPLEETYPDFLRRMRV